MVGPGRISQNKEFCLDIWGGFEEPEMRELVVVVVMETGRPLSVWGAIVRRPALSGPSVRQWQSRQTTVGRGRGSEPYGSLCCGAWGQRPSLLQASRSLEPSVLQRACWPRPEAP